MSPDTDPQEALAQRLHSLRSRLLQQAAAITDYDEAEDVLQKAYLRLSRVTEPAKLTDVYLFATVRNIALDAYRKRKSQREIPIDAGGDPTAASEEAAETSFLPEHIERAMADLSPSERRILEKHDLERKPHAEIVALVGISYAAVRKQLERARDKVLARRVRDWLVEGSYADLNALLLPDRRAALVARLCRNDPGAVASLFEALRHRELNDTVKNTVLILGKLLQSARENQEIERQLVQALEAGDLYRGQKMFAAEALIDADYRRHVYRICRYFLKCLDQLEERPKKNRELSAAETASPNPMDIYDLKRVRSIGGEMPEAVISVLCRDLRSGQGSVDYRRCIGFELQRLHTPNVNILASVIDSLQLEPDQMNAVYNIKFLRRIGLKRHPQLSQAAAEAARRVAERWTRNNYLCTSAIALARR